MMGPKCIYLDWNATTPIHPAVADAMRPFLSPGKLYGYDAVDQPIVQNYKQTHSNPSSNHAVGLEVRTVL